MMCSSRKSGICGFIGVKNMPLIKYQYIMDGFLRCCKPKELIF